MNNNSSSSSSSSSSSTEATFVVPLLKRSTPAVIVYSTAYSLVLVLAVVNNSIVLTVIRKFPPMKSVTNCFLANLASADLFVSFLVLPFNLVENLFLEWQLGWLLCKIIPYLQAVSILASVNTLTAVAIERFCVIMFPMRVIISSRRALVIIVFIWLLPACIQIPWILLYEMKQTSMTFCSLDSKSPIFLAFITTVFIVFYIIPLCIMSLLYVLIGIKVCRRQVSNTRGSQLDRQIRASKTRVVRMLVTVTVIFALSWLPLYLLKFRILFGSPLEGNQRAVYFDFLIPIAQWLGSANSCINPLIYCYYSSGFRESTKTVLKCFASFITLRCCCCCCCCCCCSPSSCRRCGGCGSGKNDSSSSYAAAKNENHSKRSERIIDADRVVTEFKMVVVTEA